MERLNIVGQKFGRLRVLSFHGIIKKRSYWNCICDCGAEKVSKGMLLMNGCVKSCGCYRIDLFREIGKISGESRRGILRGQYKVKTHGLSQTLAYESWSKMLKRCRDKKHKQYAHYGGRGIAVCERWGDVINFVKDMGQPTKGLTLDRIDNNGNYEPSNCRWATYVEQNNNTRNNVRLSFNGKTMTASQWSREIGISPATLLLRNKKGWPVEKVLGSMVRAECG